MKHKTAVLKISLVLLLLALEVLAGCQQTIPASAPGKIVPHEAPWGIYRLEIATQDISLVYSFPMDTYPSGLKLNNAGDKFVFAQKPAGADDVFTELYCIGADGRNLKKLTDNTFWDLYPAWSPDDKKIAFLTKRENDLDIYVMDADGLNRFKLFDSGDYDADIDWVGNSIVFTTRFAIWIMKDDGTQAVQVTAYPEMGTWGEANLPTGDYDPRLSPDGQKIVFERLENIDDPHGGYNIIVIKRDSTQEARLTDNAYSQGLVNWSHSGRELVFTVAAINGQGKYDIYLMNADGTDNRNITPAYFPESFLCHAPDFSADDAAIYFLGQWWQ